MSKNRDHEALNSAALTLGIDIAEVLAKVIPLVVDGVKTIVQACRDLEAEAAREKAREVRRADREARAAEKEKEREAKREERARQNVEKKAVRLEEKAKKIREQLATGNAGSLDVGVDAAEGVAG